MQATRSQAKPGPFLPTLRRPENYWHKHVIRLLPRPVPSRLESSDPALACPKCAGRSTAMRASYADWDHVGAYRQQDWRIADWIVQCTRCDYRGRGLSFEELPDLYYRAEAAGIHIWGWNRDHFVMLLRLLRGESIKGNPCERFFTYARREWLTKSNRSRLAKKMEEFLRKEE